MGRERALQIVLVLVGLLFTAALLPATWGLKDPAGSDTGDTMQMAIYVALGVFLLLAVRRPAEHRSLIAFAAWSSVAHAIVMGALGVEMPDHRDFLGGSAVLVAIAVLLIALLPPRQSATRALAAQGAD